MYTLAKQQYQLAISKLLQYTRQYFYNHQYREVAIPILNKAIPHEPRLYPLKIKTDHFVEQWSVLPTSPEKSLKEFLANIPLIELGKGVFALSPCFRYLEDNSPIHLTEFWMLEWYRWQCSLDEMIKQTITFITDLFKQMGRVNNQEQLDYQGQTINLNNWQTISLNKEFFAHFGKTLEELTSLSQLIKVANKQGLNTDNADWESLFNQLFLNFIEPEIGWQPTIIKDYPSLISPLASRQQNHPKLAQRFELYLAGIEIANGNQENLDAIQIGRVFAQEKRFQDQLPTINYAISQEFQPPLDYQFLQATQSLSNLPQPIVGVGVGISRLAMIAGDLNSCKF